MFESLESRRLLSTTFNPANNQIEVIGTDANDTVAVRRVGENIVVVENGRTTRLAATGVLGISVLPGGGNDRVTLGRNLGLPSFVSGDAGDDLIVAGNEAADLRGGPGNDRLIGGVGNDELSDDAGNNLLIGGAGHDSINGGAGDDRIFGGAGNDWIFTDGLSFTGETNNFASGAAGDDRLMGSNGADRLDGGAGDDLLDAGSNKDTLAGGAGNDRLVDPQGRNVVRGGGGWDVARVMPAESRTSAEIVELIVPPAGDAAVANASIAIGTSADGIRSATVTVDAPAGHEVVWATLPPGDAGEFRVGVSVRSNPDANLPAVAPVTRTFELVPTHQAVVVADGRTDAVLARQEFPAQPAPGPGPIPLDATDVDVRLRRNAGAVEAFVSIDLSGNDYGMAFDAMTRVGDEFFVDVAADRLPPLTLAPPSPMENTYALGALGPGRYALTVRSRAGIVETLYFDVRAG